ncbi:OmpA family protein [Aminobacter sp. MSH1]|uniref:OmpA family protein n=1 Tax=Aminobacter sp. MSH1 TaxID=374606 RepID=UPI000D3CE26D|nr:OmpA family protein [Aminobacter sp. MSH1]
MKFLALVVSIASASMLAACASAPKPPTVSGRDRTEINSPADKAALARQVFPDIPKEIVAGEPARRLVPASSTVSVHFPWNDSRFRISRRQSAELQALLRAGYVRVSVRGRTDATRPSAGDELVAARRAAAARDWLIHQGVPAVAITLNYASAADPRAGNNYSGGRALNRRVDIEIIRK